MKLLRRYDKEKKDKCGINDENYYEHLKRKYKLGFWTTLFTVIFEALLMYIVTSVICWLSGTYIPHPLSIFSYIAFLYINYYNFKRKLFLEMEREEYARMRRKIESDSAKRKTENKIHLSEIAEKDREIKDIKKSLKTAQNSVSEADICNETIKTEENDLSEKEVSEQDNERNIKKGIDNDEQLINSIEENCCDEISNYVMRNDIDENEIRRLEMEEEIAFLNKIGDEDTYKLFFADGTNNDKN